MLSTTLYAIDVMKLFFFWWNRVREFVKGILIAIKHKGRKKEHLEDSETFQIVVCVLRMALLVVFTVSNTGFWSYTL